MVPQARTADRPFQTFFVAQRAAVLRLLVGMVGPDDAQDCFQETFLKVLRAWPPAEQGASLDSWVLTIAHHTAIDLLRIRGRELAIEDVPVVAVDEAAKLAELAPRELWDAVRALPASQRAAVVLRIVLDLSHRQSADVLGSTEAAVRRAYADGLGTLRRHVGDGTLKVER